MLPRKRFALDHPALPDIEPELRQIHWDLFQDGVEAIRTRGVDLSEGVENALRDGKIQRQFVRLCHRGYHRAQALIAEALLAADDAQREAAAREVESRKHGSEPSEARTFVQVAENRTVVLRSLADALALILLKDEPWIVRRFLHQDNPPALDRDTIEGALREARFRASKNPLSFALVTDLTSGIHVGDLLEFDLSGSRSTTRLIELKSGKVNEELGAVLRQDPDLTPPTIERVAASHGDSGVRQIRRQKRQLDRLSSVANVIENERGTDPRSGHGLIISSDYIELDDWTEVFHDLVVDTRKHGGAAANIQGALQVAMIDSTTAKDAQAAATSAMGITFLQMLDGPDALPDRPAELVSRISERLYGIHDFRSALFSNEFMAPWRLPHPEFDTVFDVLFGRILIGLHLDPIGLISLSESMGQPLRWATRKEKSGLSETRGISDLAVSREGCWAQPQEPPLRWARAYQQESCSTSSHQRRGSE